MDKITKESTVGEVISMNEELKVVFEGFGMHCFHCPMSLSETIEEAAMVHGVDVDLMLEKLNEANK